MRFAFKDDDRQMISVKEEEKVLNGVGGGGGRGQLVFDHVQWRERETERQREMGGAESCKSIACVHVGGSYFLSKGHHDHPIAFLFFQPPARTTTPFSRNLEVICRVQHITGEGEEGG
jgi:hypothetical protein